MLIITDTSDARRHTIFFRINDDIPFSIQNLSTSTYTRLKRKH